MIRGVVLVRWLKAGGMIVTTHAKAGRAVEVPIREGDRSEPCDGLSTKQTWVKVLCMVQVVWLLPSDGSCIDSRIAMQRWVVLWLSTPNSVLTDLVVFLSSFILSD